MREGRGGGRRKGAPLRVEGERVEVSDASEDRKGAESERRSLRKRIHPRCRCARGGRKGEARKHGFREGKKTRRFLRRYIAKRKRERQRKQADEASERWTKDMRERRGGEGGRNCATGEKESIGIPLYGYANGWAEGEGGEEKKVKWIPESGTGRAGRLGGKGCEGIRAEGVRRDRGRKGTGCWGR